jgi:hypothetical protein
MVSYRGSLVIRRAVIGPYFIWIACPVRKIFRNLLFLLFPGLWSFDVKLCRCSFSFVVVCFLLVPPAATFFNSKTFPDVAAVADISLMSPKCRTVSACRGDSPSDVCKLMCKSNQIENFDDNQFWSRSYKRNWILKDLMNLMSLNGALFSIRLNNLVLLPQR